MIIRTFAAALLLLPAILTAQLKSTADQVDVSVLYSADAVEAGGTIDAAVVLDIRDTWHVNSHMPTFDYLIGTVVEVSPKEGVIVADTRYPKGQVLSLGFADKPISVYDGRTIIFISLRVSAKAEPGTDTVDARVTIQACNDQVCLAPSRVSVPIVLPIVAAGGSVSPANTETFALMDSDEYIRSADAQGEIATMMETEGSLVTLLAIFVIGLALNLTPCVYPMLSVTVSLFGGQTETHLGKVFLKAVVYVLGIATMYTVLGVSAALSGGLFGSWLQSPYVLGGIAVLLFGLALSSFGVYQIRVPYWVTQRLGGQTGTGIIALYLSGLVVGVFAAPCIGPPVIALLTLVGTKGDPMFGFQVFFTLSIGLGFPYLILGTFSGLLKKIPKSGAWLVWVERIFGVVLTGAALFYLALAFAPSYSFHVVPVTLFLGGLYLGFLDRSGRGKKALQRVQWAFGIVCIFFGVVAARSLASDSVEWERYSEQRLTEATENGQPVIMDFYADWCIPCIELDRNTFTDEDVIRSTKDVVRLKVDLTHFDSPEAEQLRRTFDVSGVPTIIFLYADGTEERSSRIVGFVPPEDFLRRLEPVLTE